MLTSNAIKYRGETLLGMLLATSIGAILMLWTVDFVILNYRNLARQQAQLYLQQEVEKILTMLKQDLMRIGFKAVNSEISTSNFSLFLNSAHQAFSLGEKSGETLNSCVVFFYDIDKSGCVGGKYRMESDTGSASCIKNHRNNMVNINKELFGYRLSKQRLQTRIVAPSEILQNCTAESCSYYTESWRCNQDSWADLLAKNIAISQLKFTPLLAETGDGSKPKLAIVIDIQAYLVNKPEINYTSQVITVLLNALDYEK